MSEQQPAAELLRVLRKRAGWSRDRLAKAVGMSRGNSLARYEDPAYWGGGKFPSDFVAKVALALVGQGAPPITASEVWALCESGTSLVVSTALILVPVAKWPELQANGDAMETRQIVGAVHVEGPLEGEMLAFVVNDNHAAPRVAAGAKVIVRIDDRMPTPGGVFMVALPGGVEMRLYRTNPERWESLAEPARETFYPRGAVDVIGRVRRAITDF